MKSFKLSGPGGISLLHAHQHLVFIDEVGGMGVSSIVAGHQHQLQWIPPVDEQPEVPGGQDPETGEIVEGQPAQPYQPGYWQWTPGPDGHVHEGLLEIPKEPIDIGTESEGDKVSMVMQAFRDWYEAERDSIEAGREAEEFRAGRQWNSSDASTLSQENRAVITLNKVGPKADRISGYERRQRQELRFNPVEASDQVTADIYNIAAKVILDSTNFWSHMSMAFDDALVPGRGCINLRISRDRDLRGELIAERFPWDQVVMAPSEYPDGSDVEGFCKYRWYSLNKAKKLWPNAADKLEDATLVRDGHVDSQVGDTLPGNENNRLLGSAPSWVVDGKSMFDTKKRNLLVVECHQEVFVKVPVFSVPDHDYYINALGIPEGLIAQAKTIPGVNVVEQNVRKIRITKVAGGTVLLSDEFPAELPSDEFHLVAFHYHRLRNQFWGAVESVKGSQMCVNKFASMAIDQVNRMGAPTTFFDNETFPDNEEESFRKYRSEPGAYFKLNNVNRPPLKWDGAPFPEQAVRMMELHIREIEAQLSIEPENIGANTSGQALLAQQQGRLLGLEGLFDAKRLAMIRIGRLLVPIIKKYYPPERIVRMVLAYGATNEETVANRPLNEFTEEEIVAALSKTDIEKFDLMVTESTSSPTARAANWMILTDLMQKGIQIDPSMALYYADMPNMVKKQITGQLQQQQQTQADAQARIGDAEIEKTLVAKGIITPGVAERFGIPPTLGPASEAPATPDPGLGENGGIS